MYHFSAVDPEEKERERAVERGRKRERERETKTETSILLFFYHWAPAFFSSALSFLLLRRCQEGQHAPVVLLLYEYFKSAFVDITILPS